MELINPCQAFLVLILLFWGCKHSHFFPNLKALVVFSNVNGCKLFTNQRRSMQFGRWDRPLQ